MFDQYVFVVVVVVVYYFYVYFGYQWVGCVENFQVVFFGFFVDCLGNVVGVEDDDDVVWYLIEFFDEDGVVLVQVVYDEFVVYYFVMYVDWWVEDIEGMVDDFDGVIYVGVEVVGIGEFDLYGGFVGDVVIG